MMNATLRGKPDAGNPHVRFDEGEVAPATPRRGSLLCDKVLFSIFLAMACAGIAQADDFTWIGGASGAWNVEANWSKTGTSSRTCPNNKTDTATIGTATTISFAGTYSVSQLTVNDDVVFTGGKYLAVYASVGGTGALTLSGATLRAAVDGEVPINIPLTMAEGTENALINVISSSAKAYFVVYGALRGKGNVSIHASSANYAAYVGTILSGDNSAFGGIVRIYPYWASATSNQQYDQPKIASGDATSAAAQWELNVEHDAYGNALHPGTAFFGTANETYKFGTLKANFYYTDDDNAYWAAEGITLEVGGLNLDSYAKGVCVPKDGEIDWVGETATFTNEVSQLARLRLSGGGNLVIGSSAGIPAAITFVDDGGVLKLANGVTDDISSKFKDSTASVVFDDQGVDHAWASALDESNTGGFVKRGSGTLAWPTAKGAAIEQGALAVPFGAQLKQIKIADDAVLTVDAAGKTAGTALVIMALDDLAQTNRIQFANLEPSAKVVQIRGEGNGVSYVINPQVDPEIPVTVELPEVEGATAQLLAFNVNGGWAATATNEVPSNATVRVVWTVTEDGKALTGEGAVSAFQWQTELVASNSVQTAPQPTVGEAGESEITLSIDTRTVKKYFEKDDILPIWYAAGEEVKVEKSKLGGEVEESTETLVRNAANTNTVAWVPAEQGTYNFSQNGFNDAQIIYTTPVEVTTNDLEVSGTTVAVTADGSPIEPQTEGTYAGKLMVASNSTVTATWTIAPGSGVYFMDGSTTYTQTFEAGKAVNPVSEAVTKPETPKAPKLKLGVVAQRYPWDGKVDVQYWAQNTPNEGYEITITVTLPDGTTASETKPCLNGKNVTDFDACAKFGEVQFPKGVKVKATLEKK